MAAQNGNSGCSASPATADPEQRPIIGVIVGDLAHPHATELLLAVGQEARLRGCLVLSAEAGAADPAANRHAAAALVTRVDGVVLGPGDRDSGAVELARRARIPVVVIDHPSVATRRRDCPIARPIVAAAAELLIHRVHRRAAHRAATREPDQSRDDSTTSRGAPS